MRRWKAATIAIIEKPRKLAETQSEACEIWRKASSAL
jgi:hypothetical protein